MKDAIGPRGIINGNPVFVMLLGLCPALAITTSVINAWTMGLAVIFVLVASGTVVSLLRTQLPASLSPYSEMVVIAVFVTVVELALARLSPARTEALGIYLPLIAVNCIILNQAKGSARRKTPGRAVTDALSVGVGFLLSLTLIALVREVIGRGSITLVPVGSFSGVVRLGSSPARVVVSSSGAFLVVGYLLALFNVIRMRRSQRWNRSQRWTRRHQIERERVRDSEQRTTMEGTTGGQSS